jgi:hypothetical protein
MPARTFSTDVYLTCPCPDCEGRNVRITLRKFRESLTTPLAILRASRAPAVVRRRRAEIARPNQVAPTDRQTPSLSRDCQ